MSDTAASHRGPRMNRDIAQSGVSLTVVLEVGVSQRALDIVGVWCLRGRGYWRRRL